MRHVRIFEHVNPSLLMVWTPTALAMIALNVSVPTGLLLAAMMALGYMACSLDKL